MTAGSTIAFLIALGFIIYTLFKATFPGDR